MKTNLFLAALGVVAALSSCSHAFDRVQPGMTATEVRTMMGEMAPTQIIPAGNATTWYYRESCVLFVDDRVVAKFTPTKDPQPATPNVCQPSSMMGSSGPGPTPAPPPPMPTTR